ncbi:adhesion G-protein coupled receptor F1-like [Misgurnus anguillicaudatus]|uniref:adhesion G-protein coupled receptor F1-like n=1 Tax=Misgurnus anguillicaudatus TaxID=75329 RepID=UPI003CCF3EF2
MSLSMTIAQVFDTSLAADTEERRTLLNKIQPMIDQCYKTVPDYIPGSAKVNNFRSGSIIVDYTINATSSSPDFTSANIQLANSLKQAGLPVDPNSFAESVPAHLFNTTNKIYPMQRLDLRCIHPASVAGAITWSVNKINPALDPRYSIIDSDTGSTLTVKNASEIDSGRYSCIINRNPMPYIQWQDVVIEQRPKIEVDADRVFECKDQTVPIKCCAALYSIKWDLIPDGDQLENSETNCIILQHKLLKINCGSVETFTCQLKDLKELQGYSYSRKSVTIKTSDKKFDCTSETLGIGQKDDKVNGLCENGRIGFITYQCQLGGWRKKQIECVLPILASLQSEVQVLTEEKIPGFLESLSNATVKNSIEISQSASDVKAIVDMLHQLTIISTSMTIDKTVMNTYLKTVDIIVSNQTNNIWGELNNGNTPSNTSTVLLFAIEVTSNRLSDVNFAINESSIQLEKTLIHNSFNVTSQQPNSNTQIMFSDVLEPTFVTLIIFSNLDNVLPTRNDTGTFENRINGDVVVIKVNQTVNNVSLTFDITNELLGNPQCVFWNFDLDRWDSNGCKVKHSENGKVTCECNHTTSFSILMSPFFMDDKALSYITYIGVAISMASLVLCLIIEIIVWKSVTGNDTAYMRHVSVVNISVSLLIADICFIIGAAIAKPGESTPVNPCSAVVFFIHFFYLALFFWMLTSALYLLYRTAMVFSQMSRAKMMVIAFTVGYCAPLLIAVITVASTAGAGRYIWMRDACWLNWSESKALLAFVIPALTIVAFNLLVLIVVLIVVLYKIVRRNVNASTQTDEKHALVVIVRCVAFLTPIFGLTWGFGVGTMVSNEYGLHVVFVILNSFQGFFVLVFGTLLDSKVQQSLAGKLKLNLSSDPPRALLLQDHRLQSN